LSNIARFKTNAGRAYGVAYSQDVRVPSVVDRVRHEPAGAEHGGENDDKQPDQTDGDLLS